MAAADLPQKFDHPEISMEKWCPSRFTSPNPWYDVANFLPGVATSQEGVGFPFTSLPIELISYTAKFLPKESAIALALTSRAMYGILGSEFFASLSSDQRWRLLLLLERDTDLFIACQMCRTLHNACVPFSLNAKRCEHIIDANSLGGDYIPGLACLSDERYLVPEGITSAICRLIAKRYIRHQPYGELLTMASRTKKHSLPYFKLFATTGLHMIEGSLYVREEILIAPLTTNGDLTSISAFLLDQVTNGFSSHRICPHWRWEYLGLHLAYDQIAAGDPLGFQHLKHRAFSKDTRFATGHMTNRQVYDCDGPYGHQRDCYTTAPISRAVLDEALAPALKCAILHPQPCSETVCDKLRASYRVNVVRACKECTTDICFSAQDVEGIGRVIGLTIWKKLGGVYEGQPSTWLTHSSAPTFPAQTTEPREVADVCAAFENVRAVPTSKVTPICSYMPSLGRRATSLFTHTPTDSDDDWFSFCIPAWP
jgi:hypothetical protein